MKNVRASSRKEREDNPMADSPDRLHFADRAEWRAWLEKNHASSRGVWLVYFRKGTGVATVPYDDSVEEALCFGWIDGQIRHVDQKRFMRRFSPRRKDSQWSPSNIARVNNLTRSGKMSAAGLALVQSAKLSGAWRTPRVRPRNLEVPDYMEEALMSNAKAKEKFQAIAPSHRNQFVAWVSDAKSEETRRRRLTETLRRLEKGQKLGMK